MNWYLIHTKPRQEIVALQNLEQQGYECYLPIRVAEKIRQGSMTTVNEALFPRYLFIRLDKGESAKSWSPIRSTKGVNRLVTFGAEAAKVDGKLVELLRARETSLQGRPLRLFVPGERVAIKEGAFADVEGIFQMADGESRVMILIELLSKSVRLAVSPLSLRKIS